MKKNNLPNELKNLFPIIDALSQMFGESHYEFTVHDFRYPESSLCYIKGKVTERNVGAPLTDRLLSIYRQEGDEARDVINIMTVTDKGKIIKTSSVFIRDSKGKILGSMGITIDISAAQDISGLISMLNLTINTESQKLSPAIDFANDVNTILSDLINQSIFKCEKAPAFLTKEERIELLKDMEGKGVFLIKGAIEEVATNLCVSKYTIYNHLEEIRKKSVKGR